MADIFEECLLVLRERIAPIRYTTLAEEALARLHLTKDDVNWGRQKEDVREKLLLAGRFGTGYLGTPHCVAFLRSWLPPSTLSMLNSGTPITIPANLGAAEDAAFEGFMRNKHMLVKTNAPLERVMRGRARGLITERHVFRWFYAKWPDLVLQPTNEGQWDTAVDHDFRLVMDKRVFKVDVAGEHRDGSYGLTRGKHITDLHILARIEANTVIMEGFVPGQQFIHLQSAWESSPITTLIFYLNCVTANLPYHLFKQQVRA